MIVELHEHNRNDSPGVKHDNLVEKLESFGDMYQDQNGPDIEVTVANTYYPWINGNADLFHSAHSLNVEALLYVIANPSSIPNRVQSFEIFKQIAGWYHVSFHVRFETDTAGNVNWGVFVNSLKIPWIATGMDVLTTGDDISVAASGLLKLFDRDIVDLRVTSNQAGAEITPRLVGFHMHRIAKLETKP